MGWQIKESASSFFFCAHCLCRFFFFFHKRVSERHFELRFSVFRREKEMKKKDMRQTNRATTGRLFTSVISPASDDIIPID